MTVRWTPDEYHAYLNRGQPAPVSERAWQSAVVRVLKDAGYMTYHTHDSRRSPSGWPDVAAIRPTGGMLYLCELKTETGIVSQAQQAWLEALAGCTGVVSDIWRPADLPRVIALLAEKKGL